MAKPRLDPARRAVARAPARSRQRYSVTPFPPSRLLPMPGADPEDVVVDAAGRAITGAAGGAILRYDPGTSAWDVIGETGGRPLGLEAEPDGHILVCDSHRGLLRLDPRTRQVVTLVDEVVGEPLRFCSNAVAASDGTIYFTESTNRFRHDHWMAAVLEHRGAGRLFRRDPDGNVDVLVEGIYFANGLSLLPDESALLFVETVGYTLNRLQLTGPRAGGVTVLAQNLPGLPDNISPFVDGRVWVGMASARNSALDLVARLPGFVAKSVWALPDRIRPSGRRTVWVMAFDDTGKVLADLQRPGDDYAFVTGVAEYHGVLYCAGMGTYGLLALDISGLSGASGR